MRINDHLNKGKMLYKLENKGISNPFCKSIIIIVKT